jgi:hypothetical protein
LSAWELGELTVLAIIAHESDFNKSLRSRTGSFDGYIPEMMGTEFFIQLEVRNSTSR